MRPHKIVSFFLWSLPLLFTSCKKFLEVTPSETKVLNEVVFASDASAVTAMRGVYFTLRQSSFGGGGDYGIASLAGLSSDEVQNILKENASFLPFENNELSAGNDQIKALWIEGYNVIFQANSILDALSKPNGVNDSLEKQIKGEALVLRSYCYFYLANLFGPVPLITTSDYKINKLKKREGVDVVYTQMVNDLEESKNLLSDLYPEAEKVRANSYVAAALLARVYMYMEKWEKAVAEASIVLGNNEYELLSDPAQVFLKESQETIWQLASETNGNTKDGNCFLISEIITVSNHKLRQGLVDTFDGGDLRRINWIASYFISSTTENIYYASKYKQPIVGPTAEYYVLLRFAEQYLIRAEALTRQGQLLLAISDLDEIRSRANLPKIADTNPGISQEDLLTLISEERRKELFTEWGHRWFDLKRKGEVNFVISTIKPTFEATDALYPVPESEFLLNPNLGSQNSGY